MEWWIDPGNATVVRATAAQAQRSGLFGPYPTQATARSALNGAKGAPSTPAGLTVNHVVRSKTGQWFVVNTSPSATADSHTVYTVVEGTEAQALALPNAGGISGPYASLAAANNVADAEPLNAPVSTGPGGVIKVTPGGKASFNPDSGLAAIGDFFTKLDQRATWIRIAKVAIGAIMIIAGLAKLGAPAAEKIASKLPPVIPL